MMKLGVPGELVLDDFKWKVYRQDSGMGEHDYAIFKYDVFYARADNEDTAKEIILALNYWGLPK